MAVSDEIGVGGPVEDGESVFLIRSHAGAALVPRGLRNLSGDALGVASELQEQAVLIVQAQARVSALLDEGRAYGLSWSSLGWLIGMTDVGARKMWERFTDD